MTEQPIPPAAAESVESLVGRVADEFLARRERGEDPDPAEYAAMYPHAAELIRGALAALDLAGGSLGGGEVEAEAPPQALGDYRIVREVGRGGMGVVYEAEQVSLRRRVALKVLPFAAIMDPRHLQRFKAEAVAAAALDHPHVVKVYAVGCQRGVHYIAMQYVDGRPLSDLIRDRRGEVAASQPAGTLDPTRTDAPATAAAGSGGVTSRTPLDAAYARRVAEWGIDAAEALEHAHALGVVHRDVKPGNLLIDGRGELFVADFGLARLGVDPGVTGSADLLGTPRYMSPEQAAAKHNLVDHRSDVYSLGATLYELLTLEPAVGGADRAEVLRRIGEADPTAPRKLDRRVPRDLETVVLKCLEKDPARRYQSAKDLADDLRRVLGNEPVRARRMGLLTRAGKWARRNRAAVAASSVVLLAVVMAVAGSLGWVVRDHAQRRVEADSRVDVGLAQVEDLHGRGKWSSAREVVGGLEPLLVRGGVSQDRRERVQIWRADLDMVERLVKIRSERAAIIGASHTGLDPALADREYAAAFREYGIDVEALEPDQAAELIRARPVRAELAAALDDWAAVRLDVRKRDGEVWWRRLVGTARSADPEPQRVLVREALLRLDGRNVRELADSPDVLDLSPATLTLLADALAQTGSKDRQVSLLQQAQLRHPGDYWINFRLGKVMFDMAPPQYGESLRFFTAATAIRPLDPAARSNVGGAAAEMGSLSVAADHFREAIRLNPGFAPAHYNLALTLRKQGDLKGAEASYQEAIRLKPDFVEAHNNLGLLLGRLGRLDEAVASHREATRLRPSEALLHSNLGVALAKSGRLNEAVASFREAIRLTPDYAEAHYNLGTHFLALGRLPEAEASYREAIRLAPDHAEAHNNLGVVFDRLGRWDEAEACHREAIRLNPDHAEAYNNLGSDLKSLRRYKEAEVSFREAIRLNPDHAKAHYNLGNLLHSLGRLNDAEASFREAIRLTPDLAEAHNNLAGVLVAMGRLPEAEASYRKVILLKPDNADGYYGLGIVVGSLGRLDESEACFREALRLKPDSAEAHCNLGEALRRQGRFRESLDAYRRGHELGSKRKEKNWPYPSDLWVRTAEQLVRQEDLLFAVVAGKAVPGDVAQQLGLAKVAVLKKWYATAARLYGDALRLDPDLRDDFHGPRYNAACAAILAGVGRGKDPTKINEPEHARLRKQALIWLREDLIGLSKLAGNRADVPEVRKVIRHWGQDGDLAPVREEDELKKLPPEELAEWRKLWAEVAQLRDRLAPAPAPPPRAVVR